MPNTSPLLTEVRALLEGGRAVTAANLNDYDDTWSPEASLVPDAKPRDALAARLTAALLGGYDPEDHVRDKAKADGRRLADTWTGHFGDEWLADALAAAGSPERATDVVAAVIDWQKEVAE